MPTHRLVRVASAALLLATCAAGPVAAGQSTPKIKTAVGDLSGVRIQNFGRVDSSLYRGSQPKGQDFADLKALGVKTVVDLTSFDADPRERPMTEHEGMKYVSIPMNVHTPPTAAQVASFLSLVKDPASGPVFVHCVGGKHRTGVMTAVYRMTEEGWTPDQAFKEMKKYNYGPDFLHPEFKSFVYKYRPPTMTAGTVARDER